MTGPNPRLDLVVGCNGAGKSTLIAGQLQPGLLGSHFVNADEIAKEKWPEAPAEHSYEAARIADRIRTTLIQARKPLIAETVFSHPSKLELVDTAQNAGFDVHLHIVMVPAALAVLRVGTRVESGGHDVPRDKILERYERLWPLAAAAAQKADATYVYDNSQTTMTRVAHFIGISSVGRIVWPAWTPEAIRGLTE